MAVTNIDLIEPLQGQNVGVVLGFENKGVGLSGEGGISGKVFQLPSEYLPVFDADASGPPADEDDITVYDDGVEVAVDSLDPLNGTVTLLNVPGSISKLTADFVKEFEPYIAQVTDVDVKYDETTYGRLRSSVKKKLYGAREVTISLELLMGDLSGIKIFFDSETGEMLEEPAKANAYIVLEKAGIGIGRIYFTSCRLVPKKLLGAKEGDTVSYELELTVDTNPILWDAEYVAGVLKPSANFTGTPILGDAPLEVTFTNLTVGEDVNYLWDFGDGSEDSILENPVHTYTEPGSYTVTLVATNDGGEDIKTKVNYIVAEQV